LKTALLSGPTEIDLSLVSTLTTGTHPVPETLFLNFFLYILIPQRWTKYMQYIPSPNISTSHTIKPTDALMLQLHCYNYIVTITLLQLHCYNYIVTVTLLQLHCYNYIVTIKLLQLHCYNYIVTVTLLQLHCYNYIVTITLLQLHCYSYIVTIKLLQTICRNSDMFPSILIIFRQLLSINIVCVKHRCFMKYIKIC